MPGSAACADRAQVFGVFMQIQLIDKVPGDVRLHALVVNKGDLPAGLEAPVVDGAAAARFKGRTGQTFETFVMCDGALRRVALAGAGVARAKDRLAEMRGASCRGRGGRYV